MDNLPPVYGTQPNKDNEHLKLLSIFHFVFGGLALFGLAFLVVHYLMMSTFFAHPERWQTRNGPALPAGFFVAFIWFYIFFGAICVAACILNVLSAMFLQQRKYRTFSLVIAAVDCFQIPFGTALGIFTIIVLLRDSVRQSYFQR